MFFSSQKNISCMWSICANVCAEVSGDFHPNFHDTFWELNINNLCVKQKQSLLNNKNNI